MRTWSAMEPPDASLAERALAGSDDAFGQLVTRHQNELYAYVFRMIGDAHAACDIVQTVFVRAYRSLSQLRDPGKIRPWLFAIAVNQARNWLSRRRPVPASMERADDDDPSAGQGVPDPSLWASPDAVYAAAELATMIVAAIHSLAATYREVAVLRFQHQMPVGQIATALGLGFSATESRVRRAKALLRAKLATMLSDT